ncbi:hypothetical protein GGX14DRAFT_364485 [Mycena pura]|uniref:F-box domain-containing protein n=1 Tax=Mycena pura TaxID=153505 RepID=A0AAD6VDX8_9AGAR|nr:hypothetical protein GGX14DRAFT_364485 [Mycena pura]
MQPTHKTRARALSLASLALVAASRTTLFLDIPTELGLEILELGLTHTPFSTLAAVSRAFSALIEAILYRHVVLSTPKTMSLFYRTIKSKSPEFIETRIKTLAVTVEPWRFTAASGIELEGIIAACTGLRVISVPRPAVLANSLSHYSLHRTLPSEIVIRSFDTTPFREREHSPSGGAAASPAAHLSASLSHLKIAEPGDTWHSPLSILAFFGSAPHLTHLSLARRMDANTDNDQVFVDEVQVLLASRPALRMLVVRIFPAHWPHYVDPSVPVASSTIWAALAPVAEADKRLVLVAAELEDDEASSWAYVPASSGLRVCSFWERCKMESEARGVQENEF